MQALGLVRWRHPVPIKQFAGAPRWGPRTIDIDLLAYDDLVIDAPQLTLPHPRLHERRFVLAPMAELGPALIHPKLNVTISDLLATLKSSQRVTLARADMLRPSGARREAASR